MEADTQQAGRTILFVSHNLQAIRALCPRSILIERGRVVADGPTGQVIQAYLGRQSTQMDLRDSSLADRANRTGGRVRFVSMQITDAERREKWSFTAGETIHLHFGFEVFSPIEGLGLLLSVASASDKTVLSTIKETVRAKPLRAGETGKCQITLQTGHLRPGSLALAAFLGSEDLSVFEDVIDSNVGLPYVEIESDETDPHRRAGAVDLDYEFATG